MATRFHTAVTGHAERLISAAGVSVTLKRGVASTAAVDAVPGETRRDTESYDGIPLTLRTRDFLIQAADYIISAVAVEPAAGDVIEEVVGSTTYSYELIPRFGEAAWRWSDPRHTAYRLHTVLKAKA